MPYEYHRACRTWYHINDVLQASPIQVDQTWLTIQGLDFPVSLHSFLTRKLIQLLRVFSALSAHPLPNTTFSVLANARSKARELLPEISALLSDISSFLKNSCMLLQVLSSRWVHAVVYKFDQQTHGPFPPRHPTVRRKLPVLLLSLWKTPTHQVFLRHTLVFRL